MSRSQAQDLVKGLQGLAQSFVSKETNILVLGIKRLTIFDEELLSKKEEQALQLIKEGFEIDFISEEQFLQLALDQLTRLVSNLK